MPGVGFPGFSAVRHSLSCSAYPAVALGVKSLLSAPWETQQPVPAALRVPVRNSHSSTRVPSEGLGRSLERGKSFMLSLPPSSPKGVIATSGKFPASSFFFSPP